MATELELRLCANVDGSVTIRVAGGVDQFNAPLLRRAIQEVTKGAAPPAVDITDLTHLDPAGLAVLFEAARVRSAC